MRQPDRNPRDVRRTGADRETKRNTYRNCDKKGKERKKQKEGETPSLAQAQCCAALTTRTSPRGESRAACQCSIDSRRTPRISAKDLPRIAGIPGKKGEREASARRARGRARDEEAATVIGDAWVALRSPPITHQSRAGSLGSPGAAPCPKPGRAHPSRRSRIHVDAWFIRAREREREANVGDRACPGACVRDSYYIRRDACITTGRGGATCAQHTRGICIATLHFASPEKETTSFSALLSLRERERERVGDVNKRRCPAGANERGVSLATDSVVASDSRIGMTEGETTRRVLRRVDEKMAFFRPSSRPSDRHERS